MDIADLRIKGLSPRVRGNLLVAIRAQPGGRSIPARAGEPVWFHRGMIAGRVYPRACGGTFSRSAILSSRSGLSPRVRGNRRQPGTPGAARGSIPARAGEPRREVGH